MEVETPLLASAAVTDPHIQALALAGDTATAGGPRYLQSSPEYAMKRLLAAGSGPIYQICKAFRGGESSRLHNGEFTLLEWYRPGFSLEALMDEVASLIAGLLEIDDIPRLSYREAFQQTLGIDPHTVQGRQLAGIARERIDLHAEDLDDSDYLQLLMNHCVEPELPVHCFIYDYPAAQAALAAVQADSTGVRVARRFELYCRQMELANGYFELTDAGEQRNRFQRDLARRRELGLPIMEMDEKLLAALDSGLPACAGVALGFDRLLMLASGAGHIDEVLAFSSSRA